MSSTKHHKASTPSDKDLKSNPGIGTSPGTAKLGDLDAADGENTFVGDVESDASEGGGVDETQRMRRNK